MDTYIQLGFEHILDPQGYDHVLFVLVLCAIYVYTDWKKLLVLVTAFTVGHTVTLILSGMKWINIDSGLVETLIPITILLTAIFNMVKGVDHKNKVMANYFIALGFGLIHGLGFSNFFRSLMDPNESIVMPLLKFNIGVELGQVLIVVAYLILTTVLIKIFNLCHKNINLVVSGLAALEALRMIFF